METAEPSTMATAEPPSVACAENIVDDPVAEILLYIQNCINAQKDPTLQDFLCSSIEQVAKHTDLRKSFSSLWTQWYQDALKILNMEAASGEDSIDWFFIKNLIKEEKLKSSSSSAKEQTPSTGTTQSTRTKKLMTNTALQEVQKKYNEVLEAKAVWQLKSGRIVEEVMLKLALDTVYEHPIHSLILNPEDPLYHKKFTLDELDEIRNLKSIEFDQDLPKELHDYLYSYEGKGTIKEINKAIMEKVFDPLEEPDLYWGRRSIEDTLNLYINDFFSGDCVEDDIENNVWPFISKCFAPTAILARSGKKKSQASAERYNQHRSISGHEPSARQYTGLQPDMKCTYLDYELGLSEVGWRNDGPTGTKELYECGIKSPKMLKDFFSSIINNRPATIKKVKTAAFIISGRYISVIIMDCPQGSVCRITQSERASFPGSADTCIKDLIPILELVYRVRLYLLETVDAIRDDTGIISISKKGKKRSLIPLCITSPKASPSSTASTSTTERSSKKQKP